MDEMKTAIRRGERGSALVYILIAIALLAALTVSFMDSSSTTTQSNQSFKVISEVQSQTSFVRSKIQECALVYPQGDGRAITNGAQVNQPYPLMPDDVYLDDCPTDNAETDDFVSLLRCPGNNPCNGVDCTGNEEDEACHADMFGGSSGQFLPAPVPFFGPWRYYAGDDGVFIWIESSATDSFLETAMEKLDDDFSECEVDVINEGANFQLTSDMGAAVQCSADNTCFRVWMIARATAVYPAGSPEALAGCP